MMNYRRGQHLMMVFFMAAVPEIIYAQHVDDAARLSLTTAVEHTLARYPSVEAAEASRERANASLGEAEAARYPTLSFSTAVTRFQEPMVVTPIHGFTPGRTPPFDRTLIQTGVTMSYTLFDGGSRRGRIRQASSNVSVMDADLDAVEQAVIARVVTVYLQAIAMRQRLDAHDQRLVALEAELNRVRRLYDAGRAADIEKLRVEAGIAASLAERTQSAAVLVLAERELARLTGMEPQQTQSDRLIVVSLVDAPISPHEVVMAEAMAYNPQVVQARQRLAAAEAGRRMVRSVRLPQLDLTGAYIDRGSIHGNHQAEWNLGVQLVYPFFTGGRVKYGVERADAETRAVEERVRLEELDTRRALDQAFSSIETAQAQVSSLKVAEARAAEVARIEKLRLDAGVGNQSDYLAAEATLLALRAGLVDARHAEILAHVDLARVRGRLTPDWIRQHLEADR